MDVKCASRNKTRFTLGARARSDFTLLFEKCVLVVKLFRNTFSDVIDVTFPSKVTLASGFHFSPKSSKKSQKSGPKQVPFGAAVRAKNL